MGYGEERGMVWEDEDRWAINACVSRRGGRNSVAEAFNHTVFRRLGKYLCHTEDPNPGPPRGT